jgi:hypothetical protein
MHRAAARMETQQVMSEGVKGWNRFKNIILAVKEHFILLCVPVLCVSLTPWPVPRPLLPTGALLPFHPWSCPPPPPPPLSTFPLASPA